MHVERVDLFLAAVILFFAVFIVIYRPSIESVHSLIEMANTPEEKGK